MNSVTIAEKNYVKAADIARELGYTADYVGQLCRAKKVDAQLVGRSWYVSEDSLRSHKKSRYRNDAVLHKETIAKTLHPTDADDKETFSVAIAQTPSIDTAHYAEQQFYTRAPKKVQSTYFTDENDLIPTPSTVKTGRLRVSLADALDVKIQSKSHEYDFNPTQRPEIQFSGRLAVTDVYDEDEVESEEEGIEQSKAVQKPTNPPQVAVVQKQQQAETKTEGDGITSKIKVKHLRTAKKAPAKKSTLPLEHNIHGVLGMQRARISDRNPLGGTLKVNVPSTKQLPPYSAAPLLVLVSICSVALSFVAVTLQSNMYVQGGTVVSNFTVEVQSLLAAVHAAW